MVWSSLKGCWPPRLRGVGVPPAPGCSLSHRAPGSSRGMRLCDRLLALKSVSRFPASGQCGVAHLPRRPPPGGKDSLCTLHLSGPSKGSRMCRLGTQRRARGECTGTPPWRILAGGPQGLLVGRLIPQLLPGDWPRGCQEGLSTTSDLRKPLPGRNARLSMSDGRAPGLCLNAPGKPSE